MIHKTQANKKQATRISLTIGALITTSVLGAQTAEELNQVQPKVEPETGGKAQVQPKIEPEAGGKAQVQPEGLKTLERAADDTDIVHDDAQRPGDQGATAVRGAQPVIDTTPDEGGGSR